MSAPRGYELLDQLATGGHATVWRARQLAGSGRLVALKRVAGDARVMQREAATLAALDHPHIVRIIECVADGDGVAIAMPYAEGGSLAARLGQARLPWPEAARLLAPVADALASAHRRGIVHCDVKPANILLTADGDALLSDFGVTGAAGRRGTPGYATPAARQGAEPSPSWDLHALAMTFWEAVSGQPPQADAPPPRLDELAGALPRPLAETLDRALLPADDDPLLAGELAAVLRASAATHSGEGADALGTAAPALPRRPRGSFAEDIAAPSSDPVPTRARVLRAVRWGALPVAALLAGGAYLAATAPQAAPDEGPALAPAGSATDGEEHEDPAEAETAPTAAEPRPPALPQGAEERAAPAAGEPQATSTLTITADATGDGRDDEITVRARSLEIRPADGGPLRRYEIDTGAGEVVVGDWTCDGTATPAVYRASPGQVFLYDAWPEPEAARPPARVLDRDVRHGRVVVGRDGDCDTIEILTDS